MRFLLEIVWSLFLYAAIGAGPPLLFVWLVRTGRPRPAIVLLVILGLISVAMALNLTYGIGVGIFGGAFSCLVLPVAAVSVIAVIATRAKTWQLLRDDPGRRRLYLVGAILVPLLQLVPLPGEVALVAGCDALNRGTGDGIVQALQAYHADHQAYPEDLAALVPEYLTEIPPARCFAPFAWFHGPEIYAHMPGLGLPSLGSSPFHLEPCPREGVMLLTVPSIRIEFIQRHNLETGIWSRASFLDGVCSYLR